MKEFTATMLKTMSRRDVLDALRPDYFYDGALRKYVTRTEYKLSDNAFEDLKKEFPYSGIDVYLDYIKEHGSLLRMHSYFYGDDPEIYNAIINSYRRAMYFKLYMDFPQIEQLVKAGFSKVIDSCIAGVDYYCSGSIRTLNDKDFDIIFKRNFKKASNIKDITCLSPYMYTEFKKIKSIQEWNELRILSQKYLNTKEAFSAFISFSATQQVDKRCTVLVKQILNTGWYTPATLFNYLGRINIYQAINTEEGLILIKDYLQLCNVCGDKPDLFTNSLKREHDVKARQAYNTRTNVYNDAFKDAVKELIPYEYSDGLFTIVVPKTPDDIYDEAKQQANCLACYIKPIAEKTSKIFFLRKTRHPDQSYATIEINDDGEITQKYLSHNRTIVDKRALAFLDKWTTFVQNGCKDKEEIA